METKMKNDYYSQIFEIKSDWRGMACHWRLCSLRGCTSNFAGISKDTLAVMSAPVSATAAGRYLAVVITEVSPAAATTGIAGNLLVRQRDETVLADWAMELDTERA